jgi:RNA polymerase sigma-70 factor, ECF subfamily
MPRDLISVIDCTGLMTGARRSAAMELENDVIELYDALGSSLHRYIRSFGLSRADSEETLQEAFLALFQHLQRDRPRSNLRGWIFRVAHNVALKRKYSNGRTQNFMSLDEDAVGRQADPAPNPEERATKIERYERLKKLLKSLPIQDQRCLFLRSEGLRYRDIARVLGISLGSVSISITRSLTRLGSTGEE